MFKTPQRIFIFILLLVGVLIVVDLPEDYHLKFQIGNVHVDRILNPPQISFNLFSLHIQKEIKTQYGLDLSGGTHLVLDANMKDISPADRTNALESAKQVIERRVNFFGVSEPIVQTAQSQTSYRII